MLIRTAQTREADAKDYWGRLGRTAQVTEAADRAKLLVASDNLAEAVVGLLSEAGVTAEVEHARYAAGLPAGTRVMTISVTHDDIANIVPIIPADPVVRLYPVDVGDELGEPIQSLPVSPGPDQWVSAAAIAERLRALTT